MNEIDKLNVRKKMAIPDIDPKKVSVDPSLMEMERCCGNCCFFCFENLDGEGQCPNGDGLLEFKMCSGCACEEFVSRKEMRNYMAVLLQTKRAMDYSVMHYVPSKSEFEKAIEFAYKYMKKFGKL